MSTKTKPDSEQLKRKIKLSAKRYGANLIGIAGVGRWEEYKMTEPEFYPQNIWPWAKSVISMGIQIYSPMLETTPSVVYSELYNTTNRILDEIAYKIANMLFGYGYKAHFFPRDCYGDISVLVKKPEAAFSHVIAAKYAGLGTIGMNHTLLTKEYGPRVRFVSVITDAVLPSDKMQSKDLCIRCKKCVDNCPMRVFKPREDRVSADMDKKQCAVYHEKLKREYRYPCGKCTAVCPIGADKKIWGAEAVSEDGVKHCQSFGDKTSVGEFSYLRL